MSGFALALSLLLAVAPLSFADEPAYPRGPYMGQEPPGMEPEVFAPGFVSSAEYEPLGPPVNTDDASQVYPFIAPDGEYLFFTSGRPGDIYWVDAGIFKGLNSEPAEPDSNKKRGKNEKERRYQLSAYMIGLINVTDPEQYKKYVAVTPAIIEKFGGKFIARGGESVTLEGPEEKRRIVIVEFPALDSIREFYASPEYKEAMKLREGAAEMHLIGITGV